jgi:hypothetical protein
MRVRVGIVTIGGVDRVSRRRLGITRVYPLRIGAPPVTILVEIVPGYLEALVDLTVTVVIYAVTNLRCIGIHIGIGIVTVGAIHRVPRRRLGITHIDILCCVPETVAVGVQVVAICGHILIDLSVTIVIDTVTNLRCLRIDIGISVVTVGPIHRITRWRLGITCIDILGRIAETIPVQVAVVAKRGHILVDLTVTVIIDAVANLRCFGIDIGVRVIAVTGGTEIVGVGIYLVRIMILRAIVADVPDEVGVAIKLIRVIVLRAVVFQVGNAVPIGVFENLDHGEDTVDRACRDWPLLRIEDVSVRRRKRIVAGRCIRGHAEVDLSDGARAAFDQGARITDQDVYTA